jgi:hypothetical protein
MIIVYLNGGLGNQMFQYAFGKKIANKNNESLKLDIAEFSKIYIVETPRRYNLDIFNIEADIATAEDINKIKNRENGLILKIAKLIFGNKKTAQENNIISEKHFHFDSEALEIKDNTYIRGYWQSEKYFEDIKDTIQKNFTIKIPPSNINKKTLEMIKKEISISIHIRRGDYVKDKKTSEYHGVCSLDYYNRAIKLIAKKINNPYFFVFSDDVGWAKKNLKLKYPAYFANNDDKHNYEDLRLMQNCKHNIIANSSFSWWGAWLNQNPDKIIVAPKRWFNDPNIDTSDLIPENWIKI